MKKLPCQHQCETFPAECLHIHALAGVFLRRLAMGLDRGMRLSHARPGMEAADTDAGNSQDVSRDRMRTAAASGSKPPIDPPEDSRPRPTRQFVHNLLVVRGVPMYGFHPKEQLFIKIMLYNPQHVGRASALLQSGSILGLRLQPFEAHVPFLLQVKVS